jgi:ribosome-associated translation inhibitor RaiA
MDSVIRFRSMFASPELRRTVTHAITGVSRGYAVRIRSVVIRAVPAGLDVESTRFRVSILAELLDKKMILVEREESSPEAALDEAMDRLVILLRPFTNSRSSGMLPRVDEVEAPPSLRSA